MRILLTSLSCALCVTMSAGPAVGGAWTQREGGYYLKIDGSFLTTGKELDFRGNRLDIFQERISFDDATFSDGGVSGYGEYGVTRKLTILGRLPFRRLSSERKVLGGAYFDEKIEREITSGFGDLDIGARYGLGFSPLTVSVQGGMKFPLGYDATPDDGGPPLGTGEVDSDIRILAGRGFSSWPVYLSGGIGYRLRGGSYHDEWLYEGEIGLSSGRWLVKIGLAGVENREAPQDLVGAPITTPLPGGGGSFVVLTGDQNYTKLNPSVSYAIGPGRWFTVELFDVVAGKNTIDGTTVSAGFVFARY